MYLSKNSGNLIISNGAVVDFGKFLRHDLRDDFSHIYLKSLLFTKLGGFDKDVPVGDGGSDRFWGQDNRIAGGYIRG